ncbi:MAG: hypothetical protein MJZ21_03110 [archaeon]|nr:hypothetical protein [archaeon]
MHSSEQTHTGNYVLIRWQNLVEPYIEWVGNELYNISFNGKSFTFNERCIHQIYRSGWISFDPSTKSFTSNFQYPGLGSIVEDIVKSRYFRNN